MRKLAVFNQISLDGYFSGPGGDIGWAHRVPQDPEFAAFVEGNAQGGGVLVFGRVTYDLMKSHWPTAMAAQQSPVVAERMNALPKVVFSRKLERADWSNTTIVHGDIAAEVRKLKAAPGDDMVIMGSGSIVAQLAKAGLIDAYQIVVLPVVLGGGRTMFEGLGRELPMKLTSSRVFGNGTAFLTYEPTPP